MALGVCDLGLGSVQGAVGVASFSGSVFLDVKAVELQGCGPQDAGFRAQNLRAPFQRGRVGGDLSEALN